MRQIIIEYPEIEKIQRDIDEAVKALHLAREWLSKAYGSISHLERKIAEPQKESDPAGD